MHATLDRDRPLGRIECSDTIRMLTFKRRWITELTRFSEGMKLSTALKLLPALALTRGTSGQASEWGTSECYGPLPLYSANVITRAMRRHRMDWLD